MERRGTNVAFAGPDADGATAGLAPPLGSVRFGDVGKSRHGRVYAALDLGTNNCRLLIARAAVGGEDPHAFRIVDSFCRIVRLGEGVSGSGRLCEAAMDRTIEALKVCREKIQARHVSRSRLVATEACRAAANGAAFLARVADETGLQLEVVDRETEALLASGGCAGLADPDAQGIILFDIGGGSTEVVWLARDPSPGTRRDRREDAALRDRIKAWESMKVGVVTLAELFGGRLVTAAIFEAMVAHVEARLASFAARVAGEPRCGKFHLLGTSGTATTIAGVNLGLARYDRRRVDGLWMDQDAITATVADLRGMSFAERALHGCIGPDRADLVLAGCAIFEAIRRAFPCERVRIADRGLREGILSQMMEADRVWSRDGS